MLAVSSAAPASESKSKWNIAHSSHFYVLSDASEKKADEVLLRFEQMHTVFRQLLSRKWVLIPKPLEIIAFKTREEYIQFAPLREGQPIPTSGFFLSGKDRDYIGLDLSDEESWRAVSLPLARMFLNYNYPPTPPWFDEGFAEYFSSLEFHGKDAQMGGDPAGLLPVLAAQPWLPITELFAIQGNSGQDQATEKTPVFRAESWMVMHYLLHENKLSETGTYFGLVKIQKLPVEQAIQQAYGMSSAQLDQAIHNYFRGLASGPNAGASGAASLVHSFPLALSPLDVGTNSDKVPQIEAQARLAEMAVRIPERREQAVAELRTYISQPKEETAIAHRALAWVDLQNHEYAEAYEELSSAAELDPDDPWTRYYRALVKYEQAEDTENPLQGIANMMLDLHAVLHWNPSFAEARNMLAMAQLQGGGIHAAADNMRAAIELSPRNESYLLNMAKIHMAAKQWEEAARLLDRLKESSDPAIAGAAQKNLQDLPVLQKYGFIPQEKTAADASQPAVIYNNTDDDSTDEEPANPPPAKPKPDLRKTQFLQGKLVSVDCSQAPVAILKLASGRKIFTLRTEDYKSLLVLGAGTFSCNWENIPVEVNYKAGGKADGDLVSLEIQ